jgi:DNA repair protein RadC
LFSNIRKRKKHKKKKKSSCAGRILLNGTSGLNIFVSIPEWIIMRLKELCADEMPREKMLNKGAAALSNTDLLAILLRTGRNGMNVIDVARELLKSGDGTLAAIAEMDIRKLCRIDGIGPGKAVAVAAAFELGRRAAVEAAQASGEQMDSPQKVFRVMNPITRDLDHEECWILLLNKANRLIAKEMISCGGLDSTVIDNKAIIRRAIDRKASAVILVHNHPSGSAIPSTADITQTQMLGKALKTCDLALLDHVIIARNSYYSFADERLTEKQ